MISEKGDSWKFPNDSITLKAERKEIWVRYICIHSPCDSGHLPSVPFSLNWGGGESYLSVADFVAVLPDPLGSLSHFLTTLPPASFHFQEPASPGLPESTWDTLEKLSLATYLHCLERERESSRASVFIHPLGTLSQWLMIRENKILAQ